MQELIVALNIWTEKMDLHEFLMLHFQHWFLHIVEQYLS